MSKQISKIEVIEKFVLEEDVKQIGIFISFVDFSPQKYLRFCYPITNIDLAHALRLLAESLEK